MNNSFYSDSIITKIKIQHRQVAIAITKFQELNP